MDAVRRRCRFALLVAWVGLLLSAAGAGAETPLPPRPAGAATGPTRVAGVLAGKDFVAASAIVERDFYGDLNVYLFRGVRACGRVSLTEGPYLWLSIDTGGRALPLDEALASGAGARVAAIVAVGRRSSVVRTGVSITFTRLDPQVGALWTGTIRIGTAGGAHVLSGPFAARWCGSAR